MASRGAAAPARPRPEEILAHTLSAPSHAGAIDGWSPRGRRLFLLAMAVAGVLLVAAGLLVTKELAPRPGTPAPLETGPGNGLANELLQSTNGDQPPSTAAPSIAIPLPATPTTRPGRSTSQPAAPLAVPAPSAPADTATNSATPPTTAPPAPTTSTLPCGLLGQVQQGQILSCGASTRSR